MISLLLLNPVTSYAAKIGFCHNDARSSKITQSNLALAISGEIESGDYEKILAVIQINGFIPRFLEIDSPGGDAIDGIKIGELVRNSHMTVIPRKQCNSACALVYFASVGRVKSPPIGLGLHRPYYSPIYFSKLDSTQAELKYKNLDKATRNYLKKMDVPTVFIDKMFSVPSDSIWYLNLYSFIEEYGEYAPAYYEWINAKCSNELEIILRETTSDPSGIFYECRNKISLEVRRQQYKELKLKNTNINEAISKNKYPSCYRGEFFN